MRLFLQFLIFFLFIDLSFCNFEDLLDVKINLVGGPVYNNISQFAGSLELENFGSTPTNVTFSYFIFNSSNDIVWIFKTDYYVYTSLHFFPRFNISFDDYNFEDGEYLMYVESNYGDSFIDEYFFPFFIDSNFKEEFLIKDYIWFLILVIFIFSFVLIYFLRKFLFFE